MMILNYLLALSLVLLSVVKTADLFIKSDQKLETLEKKFKETTRELHKVKKTNERGSISLTAAVLVCILSALLLFFVTKMKVEYKEDVYRKDSYLCMGFLNITSEKYIAEMAKFNFALHVAFIAKNSGVATVQAEVVFKTLTYARNARHLLYLKKLAINKYCRAPETFSYLKNPPFLQTKLQTLETDLDETTKLRQSQWTYTYCKNPQGIRLKKSFCLKSDFKMQNVFLPKLTIKTQEIAMLDLSNLKCFFGLSL